ncbi:MAG: FAD-dependent oxidoreductase, partial [Clostridia bacterium]|nr:FAD-dependent oxidoreductase [Clostridia bacterium]
NIELVLNSNVTKLLSDGRLSGVEVTDKLTGETRTLDVAGLFVAVGQVPENQNFAQLIDLDTAGYAVAGEDCLTKAPGVFVAGDNRVKDVRQLITAAADGAVAATAAIKYLNE